jgi:ABC-type phosphate transport system substrate-binding protein
VTRNRAVCALALVATAALAGCAGSAVSGGTGSPGTAATAPDPSAVTRKVSANSASRAELAAALAAAGVPNAERWAIEIEEYRPYPADDPTFAKLRRELAKYRPAPGVVDRIVSVLAP